MSQAVISEWGGAAGGSQDNYPALLNKCKLNFAEVYSGLSEGDYVKWYDDFLGDALDVRYATLLEGTDSTTIDAAILVGGIGGVLRCTTGDAGTGLAADMGQLVSVLQWQSSNGELNFEARVKWDAITNIYCFLGFTDVVTLEAPIISAGSADTITTTASDAVGFMFDTRMATDNWWLVGVATDVDAVPQNSGFAPVAATYEKLRVSINAAGVATFFRNGTQVGTTMVGALTPGTDLTATINFGKLSVAASALLDVDYLNVSMLR